jgi:hypothetical protein
VEDEAEREQLIALAQTIGMQAMELPAEQRQKFIHRTIAAIHGDFARKHGTDPSTAEMAGRLADFQTLSRSCGRSAADDKSRG